MAALNSNGVKGSSELAAYPHTRCISMPKANQNDPLNMLRNLLKEKGQFQPPVSDSNKELLLARQNKLPEGQTQDVKLKTG